MWPFSRKAKTPDRLPIDGPWSLGQAEDNGAIMFVRTNVGYRDYGSVVGYEHQVGIAVPLRAPEPSGLPCWEENAALEQIEDTICQSLEVEAESLFVAVITANGMREFIFYTRASEGVKQRFEQLRTAITSHEIQLSIQPDKAWEVYRQFA